MSDVFQKYKSGKVPLPKNNLRWEMYGSGLENFGKDGRPAAYELTLPGPDQLLLRTDAVGICFSDVKLTTLGADHPRITGRDLKNQPVVPGHEVAATVVAIGENLKDKFQLGARYTVQADVFFKGESMAYGYVLPGAMQQYGLVGPEVLQGDEGCYLVPLKADTGYLQAALAEPWACVVAAYRIPQRQGVKKGGFTWFYNTGRESIDGLSIGETLKSGSSPSSIVVTNITGILLDAIRTETAVGEATFAVKDDASDFARLSQEVTGGKGFDDIIVLGAPTSDEARELSKVLGTGGVMNIVSSTPVGENVEIDIGRVHYDSLLFVGSAGPEIDQGYKVIERSELLPGGTTWFIGAAGPMGQMHVQRAVELKDAPAKIFCTDIDDSRIEMLRLRVDNIAKANNIEIVFANPTKMEPGELEALIEMITDGSGFDDIVSLVPVAALITHAAQYVADYGVFNIFAGVPRGTKAMLPIQDTYLRQVRYIGSSGSRLSDLEDTLHLSEDGILGTANSAAAIGGMNAMNEGIAAVKSGKYPGKTVIFPQFSDFPLTAITDLKEVLPSVYSRLRDGLFWTKDAEEEFFRVMLANKFGELEGEQSLPKPRRLLGKVALITGAAQGLGQALAMRMAEEGAKVSVVDLNLDGARGTADKIESQFGQDTLAFGLDVTSETDFQLAIEQTVDKFGKLDILVANAGILIAGPIEEFNIADWRKVIDVNLVGYMVAAKCAAKQMINQKSGVILQINSKSGKKGSFRNSAYAASKFGGIGLTQSLALELAPYGIRVNAICPGNLLDSPLWVDSLYEQYSKTQGLSKDEVRKKYESQVPLGRGCSYEDIGNVLLFLASEEASYMTGQAINVTGGQQMD